MWRVVIFVLEFNLRSYVIVVIWEIVLYLCLGDCINWFELSLKVFKNIINVIVVGVWVVLKISC